MLIEFIHFLNNPNYLSLTIGKMNNYEVDEYTEFDYDENSDKFILKTK